MEIKENLEFVPVVIIGAGRSGTNALRDALVQLEEFATWPCDEINPVWRHGNLDHPDDEIPPERATPPIRSYIRNAFRRIWRQQNQPRFIVEKTCANSLRVQFVDAILPEARFIYIVRDGYDVVASAQKRWRGELEVAGLPYFVAKARYAPLTDLPRYALTAIKNRLMVLARLRNHLPSWGPRFSGMEQYANAPLEELVARQWAVCVARSDEAFSAIEGRRVLKLRYEDFTGDAAATLAKVCDWLGAEVTPDKLARAASSVRKSSVGKGREAAEDLPDHIHAMLKAPLTAHGYLD